MTGVEFLQSLPPDLESLERCCRFRRLIAESRRSPEARALAIEVYHAAASGGLLALPLHDLNMLLYSLEENPTLLAEVESDLDAIFNAVGVSSRPLARAWQTVRSSLAAKVQAAS
jgi:hypothetical protein